MNQFTVVMEITAVDADHAQAIIDEMSMRAQDAYAAGDFEGGGIAFDENTLAVISASTPEPVPCVLCTSPDYCAAHGCRQRPSGDEPQRNADFEAGWRTAANWMDRDDLIADIGSPAYLDDRAKALAASGVQEVPRG